MTNPLAQRSKVNLARRSGTDVVQTVMIVEDEFFIRLDLADYLREAGFKVIECSTADDAIDLLRAGTAIDVLFTDIRMPGSLDGIQLAHMAMDEFPGLVVMVTSAEPPRAPVPAPFLSKPYTFPEVLTLLRKSTGT